jgi:hypothetical protein
MQLIPKNVIAYDQNLVLHARKIVNLSLYRLLVSRDMSDFLEEIRRGEGLNSCDLKRFMSSM